mgnify:CR=1 FL=1
MAYVDEHLLPGEEVRHRAHIHKINYIAPAVASMILVPLGIGTMLYADMGLVGPLVALLGLIPLVGAYISYTSSEFAVTNKRVIIKTGWIQRNTLETLLGKIEAISVDQSVLGRFLGYGTITITGTGGTEERFQNIADPLDFRRQVQAQVTAPDDARIAFATAGQSQPREERDCPYCAERILTRAKVCKHCGRDVVPLAQA